MPGEKDPLSALDEEFSKALKESPSLQLQNAPGGEDPLSTLDEEFNKLVAPAQPQEVPPVPQVDLFKLQEPTPLPEGSPLQGFNRAFRDVVAEKSGEERSKAGKREFLDSLSEFTKPLAFPVPVVGPLLPRQGFSPKNPFKGTLLDVYDKAVTRQVATAVKTLQGSLGLSTQSLAGGWWATFHDTRDLSTGESLLYDPLTWTGIAGTVRLGLGLLRGGSKIALKTTGTALAPVAREVGFEVPLLHEAAQVGDLGLASMISSSAAAAKLVEEAKSALKNVDLDILSRTPEWEVESFARGLVSERDLSPEFREVVKQVKKSKVPKEAVPVISREVWLESRAGVNPRTPEEVFLKGPRAFKPSGKTLEEGARTLQERLQGFKETAQAEEIEDFRKGLIDIIEGKAEKPPPGLPPGRDIGLKKDIPRMVKTIEDAVASGAMDDQSIGGVRGVLEWIKSLPETAVRKRQIKKLEKVVSDLFIQKTRSINAPVIRAAKASIQARVDAGVLLPPHIAALGSSPVLGDAEALALLDRIGKTATGKMAVDVRNLRSFALRAVRAGKEIPPKVREAVNDLLSQVYVETLGRKTLLEGGLKVVAKDGRELAFGISPTQAREVVAEAAKKGIEAGVQTIQPGDVGTVLFSFPAIDLDQVVGATKRIRHAAGSFLEDLRKVLRGALVRRFEKTSRISLDAAGLMTEAEVGVSEGVRRGEIWADKVTEGLTPKEVEDLGRLLLHDTVEADWKRLQNTQLRGALREQLAEMKKAGADEGLINQVKEAIKESKGSAPSEVQADPSILQDLMLSPEEYERIVSNPNIQAAVARHVAGPQADALALRRTIMESLLGEADREAAKARQVLQQKIDELTTMGGEPSVIQQLKDQLKALPKPKDKVNAVLRTRREGDLGTFISLVPDYEAAGVRRAGSLPGFRPQVTPFSKARTYSAGAYLTDYRKILRAMFRTDVSRLRKNQFYEFLLRPHDEGGFAVFVGKEGRKSLRGLKIEVEGKVLDAEKFVQVPKETIFAGSTLLELPEEVPEKIVQLMKTKPNIYLPREIAEDLMSVQKQALSRQYQRELDAFSRFHGFMVGMQLGTPAEAAMHAHRIFSVVSKVPWGETGLKRLLYSFPFVSSARDFKALLNYSDAEGRLIGDMMARVGAFPDRVYQSAHELEVTAAKLVDNTIGKVSKTAAEVVKTPFRGRKFLFGPSGLDVRARTVLAKKFFRNLGYKNALEAADDFYRSPALRLQFQEFLNGLGQYTNGVMTDLTRSLMQVRKPPFGAFPFARTQVSLIPTELKQLFGGFVPPGMAREASLAYRAEVLYRGTLGRMTAHTLLNYALSGKWPWENERGHMFDLNLGSAKDGRDVYIPLTSLDPALSRATRLGGPRAVARGFEEGSIGAGFAEQARNLANQSLSLLGPKEHQAFLAVTGKAPYLTQDFSLLQVSQKKRTPGQQALVNLKTALSAINPIFHQVYRVWGGVPERSVEVGGALGIAKAAGTLTGHRLHVGRTELERRTLPVRVQRGRDFEVIRDIVNQAWLRPKHEGMAYLTKRILEEFPGAEAPGAFRAARDLYFRRFRSLLKSGVK